jgi:hypothetical protein
MKEAEGTIENKHIYCYCVIVKNPWISTLLSIVINEFLPKIIEVYNLLNTAANSTCCLSPIVTDYFYRLIPLFIE